TPKSSSLAVRTEHEPWETGETSRFEEFSRAIPLALFDYLRKSKAGGFVVSASGGADSTAVAILVSLMVQRGVAELGAQGFVERLPAVRRLASLVAEHQGAPPGELERQ